MNRQARPGMIIIRDEQIEAFRQASVAGFEARVLADLLRSDPLLFDRHGSEALTRLIRRSIANAAELGLLTEPAVQRFIVCAFRHGEDFIEERDWAREIVNDPSLPPLEKLSRLESKMP